MALINLTCSKPVSYLLHNSSKAIFQPDTNTETRTFLAFHKHHSENKYSHASIPVSPLKFSSILERKRDKHAGLSMTMRTLLPRAAVDNDHGSVKETERPTIWDDILLSPDNQVKNYAEAVDRLKEQVRKMVVDKETKPEDKMILIDTLERLGVAYHFEQEIEEQIAHIFELQHGKRDEDYDLFTTSLHFRMFRLHGYNVPSSVFNKFKDDEGRFKKAVTKDIKGLLSLYEATYVRFRQDDILHEANVFATHHIRNATPLLHSSLQERVARIVSYPIHRTHARLEARHYISIYDKQDSKNEMLLRFAKLDFNLLQNLHKEEISRLMRWWKGLGISPKQPYKRNIVVEGYYWGAANLDSQHHSLPRLCAAKTLMLYIIINDAFDSHATWEEAKEFEQIMQQRWDIEKINQLPDYMQVAYKAILTTFGEFDRETSKQGRPFAAHYAREAMRRLTASYLKTASWLLGDEEPTFLKSTSNGLYDSGIHGVAASYLLGLESASEDTFKWLMSAPALVEAAGQYVRYMNDIASYKREHKEGARPNTSVDCYMKEHHVSKEEAIDKLRELAEDAWMGMNWEWISTSSVRREFLKPVINYARSIHVCYGTGLEGFSNPETGFNNDIAALFLNPLPIN